MKPMDVERNEKKSQRKDPKEDLLNPKSAPSEVPEHRSLLKDKAYVAIKESIMSEEFPPGTFLAERRLATLLGMSKTPVKAALERLAVEGFIAISPQQCILVRDLPFGEIADQYEIRTALETYIVRGLAERITKEQAKQLQRSLASQAQSLGTVDVGSWVEQDAAFHLLLAEIHGNQAIYRVMLDLRDRMYRIINRVFQLQPLRIEESYGEHSAIVEAILKGDGEKAVLLVSTHLQRGRDLVLAPRH